MTHNQTVVAYVRTLVRRGYYAKETRQWALLRQIRRLIRQFFKLRHLSNMDAIRRIQGV